jgi:hypothetical protein
MKEMVVIAGPLPEPKEVFERANFEVSLDHVFLADTLDEGIRLAGGLVLLAPESVKPPAVSTTKPA